MRKFGKMSDDGLWLLKRICRQVRMVVWLRCHVTPWARAYYWLAAVTVLSACLIDVCHLVTGLLQYIILIICILQWLLFIIGVVVCICCSVVQTMREHNNWVLKAYFDQNNLDRFITGRWEIDVVRMQMLVLVASLTCRVYLLWMSMCRCSVIGDIRYWDRRSCEASVRTSTVGHSVSCLDIHPYANLIAWFVYNIHVIPSVCVLDGDVVLR